MVRSKKASVLNIVLAGLCLSRVGLAFQHQHHHSITNPAVVVVKGVCKNTQPTTTTTTTALYASPVNPEKSRRAILRSTIPAWAISSLPLVSSFGNPSYADETNTVATSAAMEAVEVIPKGDIKKLFNEARAMESQGNMPAAQRIYAKITKVAPRFIYGWSQLGNTQVALGALSPAEVSYTNAIELCKENLKEEERFGVPRCNDLYLLYLNRGSLRLNNKMPKEALLDLDNADRLRAKPDAIILQNRARARELNGLYAAADRDYAVAISMTSNEVAPFWLRSALVKFQTGDLLGAFDLIRRVENRFPEAPEVRAALATLLSVKGDQIGAQRKYLEIPDKQRLKYMDDEYLQNVIAWPPKMVDAVKKLAVAVGDAKVE